MPNPNFGLLRLQGPIGEIVAEATAIAVSSTSIRNRILPGAATATCRLSPVVENTPGNATRTAKAGIAASQLPARSAATHGPAIDATNSMANLDSAENIVSRGLSNLITKSLLLMQQKLSGARHCIKVVDPG